MAPLATTPDRSTAARVRTRHCGVRIEKKLRSNSADGIGEERVRNQKEEDKLKRDIQSCTFSPDVDGQKDELSRISSAKGAEFSRMPSMQLFEYVLHVVVHVQDVVSSPVHVPSV